MTNRKPSDDLSKEQILESIGRIVSEGESRGRSADAGAATLAPPSPPLATKPSGGDEVLDLVDVVDEQGNVIQRGQARRGRASVLVSALRRATAPARPPKAARPLTSRCWRRSGRCSRRGSTRTCRRSSSASYSASSNGLRAAPSPSETFPKGAFTPTSVVAPSSRIGYETTMLEKTYRPADFEGPPLRNSGRRAAASPASPARARRGA